MEKKSNEAMSTQIKFILGIVLTVIAIGVIWWMAGQNMGADSNEMLPAQDANTNSGSLSAQSDASLDQDLMKIDAQMSNLESDSKSVDQSMNDKPIPQE